jgi:hypothetical protein
MISSFFKKGFGGAVGIATLSLISAGMLGTNMYNDGSNKDNALHEANQLINYVNAISTRLNLDGGVALQTDPGTTSTAPKGSFWSDNARTPKSIFIRGNTLDTFTKLRHLFINKNTKCQNKPSEKGTWYSPLKTKGASSAQDVYSYSTPSHLIACNAYRIKAPFKNTIYSSSGGSINKDSVVINIIAKSHVGVAPTDIEKLQISIPLTNYINYSKKATIKAIREVANKLSSSAEVFISRGAEKGVNKLFTTLLPSNPTYSEVYGTSASAILGKTCNNSSGKQCYLNIVLYPIKAAEGGGSGCTDCLKLDGTNSMKKAITFNNGSASFSGPLLAWNTTPAFIETPTATQVKSGLVAESTGDLSLKLDNIKPLLLSKTLKLKKIRYLMVHWLAP